MSEWHVMYPEIFASGIIAISLFIIAVILWRIAGDIPMQEALRARGIKLFAFMLVTSGVSRVIRVFTFFYPIYDVLVWSDMIAAVIAFATAIFSLAANQFTHPQKRDKAA